MAEKISALEKTYDECVLWLAEMGEPAYRATQLCNWIWKRGVFEIENMTDFSKALREKLRERMDVCVPEIVKEERSKTDGTKKFLISMADGAKVETALLKQGDRLTACLSTQVGCAIGCPFCATGSSGFERNLTAGEIAGQFVVMEKHLGREINNIVFMGMGEPLLNTNAVLRAIHMLNDPKMRGLGIRHIALSTAGIVPGIRALAAENLGIRLAVSLHASDDELRDELVPCNANYPISELMQALHDYQETTGDRITIEYALFRDKNDSLEHARKLARLLHGLHVFVNLIPANENKDGFERSKPETVLRFQSVLKSAGFESEIRVGRGGDIKASCGQLKAKEAEEPAPAQIGERPKGAGQAPSNKGGGHQANRGNAGRRSQTPSQRDGKPRKDFSEHQDRSNRPERSDRPARQDRSARPEYSARSDRPARQDRSARPEYSDRPARQDRSNRPEYSDRPARSEYSDRPARQDRSARPEYSDRPARQDRSNRLEYSDRPARQDRSARPEYSDRPARQDRSARPEYSDRPARQDRSNRPEYSDRPARQDRSNRPEYSDRPVRQDRSNRSEYSDRPARQDRSNRPEYSDRPARQDRSARPEYSDRPARQDHSARPEYSDRPARPEYSDRSARSERPSRPAQKNKPGDARKPKRTK